MRFSFLLLALLLVAGASFAGQSPVSAYIFGGATLPMSPGEFRHHANIGVNAGAGLGVNIGQVSIIGKSEFYSFSMKEYNDLYVCDWNFGVDARYYFAHYAKTRRFYVMAGMGYFAAGPTGERISDPGDAWDAVTEFKQTYYNIGGGIEFGKPGSKFFIEARYVRATVDEEYEIRGYNSAAAIPVTLGLRFF